jgi:hypothetical protein
MSRYFLDGIQGFNLAQTGQEDFLKPRELINNTQISMISAFGNVFTLPRGKIYNKNFQIFENAPQYSEKFRRGIFYNHMLDHYLKMYYKLMLGLDFNEYMFQLTPESAIRTGPDGSNQFLLNQIIENNEILFPESATDINSARELDKINRGISNSLFFNSERYMKACLYPNLFDRVFSVFINERDFIYASPANYRKDATGELYDGKKPEFSTVLKLETPGKIKIPLGQIGRTAKYYNKTLDKDFPQIYMYYAEISLLKRIEKPPY